MLNIRTKILVCGYLVQGADFWGSYVYGKQGMGYVPELVFNRKGG